jgi:hypothetical protein
VIQGENLAKTPESGTLYVEISGDGRQSELAQLLKDRRVMGLAVRSGIPTRPEGPALACRIQTQGSEAIVQVATTDPTGREWASAGKFTMPLVDSSDEKGAFKTLDSISEGILSRIVRAQLIKGKTRDSKGNELYQIRIENASPLVLNGIALVGPASAEDVKPTSLAGLSLSPRKRLVVPATGDVVNRLGLKEGIRVLAVDLSGL